MKNQIPLCAALVDALLVFETSSDHEVDPDTAVRAIEHMSSSLQELSDDDQRELRALFSVLESQSDDLAYSSFVRSVPDMLGLQG